MKNVKYFILLFALAFVSITNVNAASITDVKYKDNKFQITGTGTGEVQIVVFDKTNSPIYMSTVTSVDGIFNSTLPSIDNIVEGDYTFKVSDYDGSNVNSKAIKIKSNKIYVQKTEHGTVTVDKSEAINGKKITISVTTEKGYKLKSLTGNYYVYSEGAILIGDPADMDNAYIASGTVTKKDLLISDNSFVMPDDDPYTVTIKAEFGKESIKDVVSNIDVTNPQTYDGILLYVIITIIGISGLILVGLKLKGKHIK